MSGSNFLGTINVIKGDAPLYSYRFFMDAVLGL